MEVWNGQIMDIGLMVTGYLAAAGLGMLLHAAFAGRRRRAAVAAETAPEAERTARGISADYAPQVQFIDLRASQSGAAAAKSVAKIGPDGRRDRVEIVRLARQMLNAGTPAERVRRTLPITEAELTLLQSIEAN